MLQRTSTTNNKGGGSGSGSRRRNRRPIPLTLTAAAVTTTPTTMSNRGSDSNPPPTVPCRRHVPMKSRKRARQVTTLFHKYTHRRDLALAAGDTNKARDYERRLDEMGGRIEYQKASQLSTTYHSTSKKWVLGHLACNGWLYGIKQTDTTTVVLTSKEQRKAPRRTTRILEVGAINTDLLDAAAATIKSHTNTMDRDINHDSNIDDEKNNTNRPQNCNNNIHVRSIDLHAMDPRIEEVDFLDLPYLHPTDVYQRYDVVVCSMVLNCVTRPTDRGKMLCRLYHHLRPGGLCFLTVPKFCLTKSAFLTFDLFQQMLVDGVGFEIHSTKQTPRIAFFLLKRPTIINNNNKEPRRRRRRVLDPKWTQQVVRNKGKKFPNQFSVVLQEQHVFEEEQTNHKQTNQQTNLMTDETNTIQSTDI